MFAAHHRLEAAGDRRRERPAGARIHERRARPLAAGRSLAGLRLGRTRWTGTTYEAARRSARAELGERRAADVVVAHTVFGKGVSFMENRIEWHYWPMSDDAVRAALAELEPRAMRTRVRASRLAASSAARDDPPHRAADRRPRLHGAGAVRGEHSGPLLQRRRRRAEHARPRDRTGRGRFPPVRLLDRDVCVDAPVRVHPQRPRAARPARPHGRRSAAGSTTATTASRTTPSRTSRDAVQPGVDASSPRPTRPGAGRDREPTTDRPDLLSARQGRDARCRAWTAASSSAAPTLIGDGSDVALSPGRLAAVAVEAADLLAGDGMRRPVAVVVELQPVAGGDLAALLERCRWRSRSRRTTCRRARLAGRRDDRRARARLPPGSLRRARRCRAASPAAGPTSIDSRRPVGASGSRRRRLSPRPVQR